MLRYFGNLDTGFLSEMGAGTLENRKNKRKSKKVKIVYERKIKQYQVKNTHL